VLAAAMQTAHSAEPGLGPAAAPRTGTASTALGALSCHPSSPCLSSGHNVIGISSLQLSGNKFTTHPRLALALGGRTELRFEINAISPNSKCSIELQCRPDS